MKLRLLIVEDDARLGAQIQEQMLQAGFETTWLDSGDDALREAPDTYHLIILDLMLPGVYGMDILRHYRSKSEVPVILLTARDHPSDRVRGLELGADDYVTKPFWPEELLARVQARLRRPALTRNQRFVSGALSIDLEAHEVHLGAQRVELTKVEFALLAALVKRPGQAITREVLVERALDPDRLGHARTLDVHVSRLRKKLGEYGRQVATVWGIGYRWCEDEPTSPSA